MFFLQIPATNQYSTFSKSLLKYHPLNKALKFLFEILTLHFHILFYFCPEDLSPSNRLYILCIYSIYHNLLPVEIKAHTGRGFVFFIQPCVSSVEPGTLTAFNNYVLIEQLLIDKFVSHMYRNPNKAKIELL